MLRQRYFFTFPAPLFLREKVAEGKRKRTIVQYLDNFLSCCIFTGESVARIPKGF